MAGLRLFNHRLHLVLAMTLRRSTWATEAALKASEGVLSLRATCLVVLLVFPEFSSVSARVSLWQSVMLIDLQMNLVIGHARRILHSRLIFWWRLLVYMEVAVQLRT